MISYQIATLKDIPALHQLINSAYRGSSSEKGWTTEAHILGGQRTDEESLRDLIQKPHNQILLMLEDFKLVGCVHLVIENSRTLYFGMLTIKPTLQAQGRGKELLKEIDRYALSQGLNQIRITVIHTRKELIAYYERRGFVSTGKMEDFPMNNPKFGLPKVSDLKFIEFIKQL